MTKLVNTSRVADMLGESEDFVYAKAREGILPCVRIGRKVKFQEEAILEFIRNGGKALPGGWKKQA